MEAHSRTTGSHGLFDPAAARKPTRLRVNGDLAAWRAENREAIEAYNELVNRDGVFSSGLRGF